MSAFYPELGAVDTETKDGNMEIVMNSDASVETIATPDAVTFLPVYLPTIEETVKASGGHRQMTN